MQSQWSLGPTYTESYFDINFILGQRFWPRYHHSPSSNCLGFFSFSRFFSRLTFLNLLNSSARRAHSPSAHSCSNPALPIRHSRTGVMLVGAPKVSFISQCKNTKHFSRCLCFFQLYIDQTYFSKVLIQNLDPYKLTSQIHLFPECFIKNSSCFRKFSWPAYF